MRWERGCECLISADGGTILGRTPSHGRGRFLGDYLLGGILSFALLRRGIESLHGAVVAAKGSAVGFLGGPGAGKSTLAAAFLAAGFPLVTDDLLVLGAAGDSFRAYPGPARIKLAPPAARLLLDPLAAPAAGDGVPRLDLRIPDVAGSRGIARAPKWILPLPRRLRVPSPLPLRGLYVLDASRRHLAGAAGRIRRLPPRRAVREILRATFNALVLDPSRLRRQFHWAAGLAARVPVKRLSYPRRLEALSSVREAVLRDIERESRG